MADVTNEDERREAQENWDRLMQEGLDSGPSTPMTALDWEEVRRDVQRLAEERIRTLYPASAKAGILHL